VRTALIHVSPLEVQPSQAAKDVTLRTPVTYLPGQLQRRVEMCLSLTYPALFRLEPTKQLAYPRFQNPISALTRDRKSSFEARMGVLHAARNVVHVTKAHERAALGTPVPYATRANQCRLEVRIALTFLPAN
jgi:hypothetical protein